MVLNLCDCRKGGIIGVTCFFYFKYTTKSKINSVTNETYILKQLIKPGVTRVTHEPD